MCWFSFEIGIWWTVSAYAEDVAVIRLDISGLKSVGSIQRNISRSVVGTNVNADKSVGMRLRSRRGISLGSDCVIWRWTEEQVNLLNIRLRPELHVGRSDGYYGLCYLETGGEEFVRERLGRRGNANFDCVIFYRMIRGANQETKIIIRKFL